VVPSGVFPIQKGFWVYANSSPRVIIVLVDFPDVELAPSTKERVKDLWFSTDCKVPTGSVNEYFSEVSNGAVNIAGEVIGPFTLSHKMSYYSNNGKTYPITRF
jgi:immune inhibitor A